MSFDYASLAYTSRELLTEFGQAVTQRSYTVGTYDPATGAASPASADSARVGAMFDFGAGKTLERGGLIQAGDKRLLVDADADISPQDHFIVNSVDYVIVSIGEINPAGTRVLYDLHLRT